MAHVASRVPSFGGFFMEEERLVGLVTDLSEAPAVEASLRDLQGDWIGTTDEELASKEVVVREADFSFRQLAQWRDLAFEHVLGLTEVVSLDLEEVGNRVEIGLSTMSAREQVEATLIPLGVPSEALTFVLSDFILDIDLTDYFRPTRGGFQIHVVDEFAMNPAPCSLGFNAIHGVNDDNVYLTASHCTAEAFHLDGGGAYQDTIGGGKWLGYEHRDPDPFSCSWGVCRYSDTSILKYMSHVEFDFGFLARPNGPPAVGYGNCGSTTIDSSNPKFEITDKDDYPFSGQEVHKVGYRCGWTSGEVERTCVEFQPGGPTRLCSYGADYGALGGDSGAPVSLFDGSTVTLQGMHIGRDVNQQLAYFSPIGGIEQDLGSITVESNPPPLIASILGPDSVQAAYPCEWWSDVSGGAGGYTYEWSGVLSGTSSSVSGSLSSSGWLYLTVTDAEQNTAGDELSITVTESAPECGI